MASDTLSTQETQTIKEQLTWLNRVQDWANHYRLLILAMIGTVTFHAGLLFNGSLWRTYDAFVHMFFADHYARGWFDLWEERWYTGFTMVSYPPLTHQINAALSYVVGIRGGYIVLMLIATVLTTIGVYRFSRLWVSHRQASYAALVAVFASSIAETVHVFGQSPTMFVIGVLLNSLPFIWHYVDEGDPKNLLRAWAILMVACAGHHVTTIFGMVFFCGPILATLLWRRFRTPRMSETLDPLDFNLRNLPRIGIRRIKRFSPVFIRCGIFGVGFIIIAVTTVLPYWLWSRSDPITQVTIPHGSRENFLIERNIGFMFFVVPWGVLFFTLPYALYKGFTTNLWILTSSLALLTLLGTGGTTPIPAALLGGAFYILTLDRFTFWATIVILPYVGLFLDSLLHGRFGQWLTAYFGGFWRIITIIAFGGSLIAYAIFVANLTHFRKFQPDTIDMQPIVEFLAKDNHDAWRYMTLGFGDQLAWLSAQTTALNVEGNYHSARRLPEMTSTPIERMDGAKYQALPGLGTLHQILSNPQRYNLKYIFVNDAFYEPLLHFFGWHSLGALDNGIVVWERADVPPLPSVIPQVDYPDWQRLMWGILPPSSLLVTLVVFSLTALVPLRPSRWFLLRHVAKWKVVREWWLDSEYDYTFKPDNSWQFWRKYTDRVQIRLKLRTKRQLYGVLLFMVLMGIIGGIVLSVQEELTSPETILLNYYDDIDFKRFSESYNWLQTDLSPDEYLRYLSLRGGIVASFSKLENMFIESIEHDGDTVEATVVLDWLTALGSYPQQVTHTLVDTPQGWRIVLDVASPEQPSDIFLTTQSQEFFLDLPIPSLEDGALNRGVLDRSLLAVGDLQIVYAPDVQIGFVPEEFELDRFEGRWNGLISVMGIVQNRDAYPAHVTVTAIFRDDLGNRLGVSNAAAEIVHQLLPDERTPFRVDFFGAAATNLLDIEQLASVELVVQGVPTQYNLARPIIMLDSHTLYNTSSTLVDIPRVLVREMNNDGIQWVQNTYIEQAIAPNATQDFVYSPIPSNLRLLNVDITTTGARLEQLPPHDSRLIQITGFSR